MMKVAIAIVESFCLLIGIILRYLPFRDIVVKKQKRALFITYFIIFLINIIFLLYISLTKEVSRNLIKNIGVVTALVNVLVNIIIIKKHFKEHLFTLGLVIIFNYLLTTIPTYIVQHTIGFESTKGYLFFAIYNFIFLIAAFIPIKEIMDKTVRPFLNINVGKYWNTIWFIPIALLTALLFMMPHEDHIETIEHLLGHGMLAVVMVLICFSISKDYNSIKEKQKMGEHINKSKVYYSGLKTRMEEIRKNNHDLKHLLISIRHYVDTDDKTGLSNFCDSVEQSFFNKEALPYTGNASVDGIVYHYTQLAKNQNIEFTYTGGIKNNGIGDMDLCVLLGNALDNAFTACSTLSSSKRVSLIAQSEENVLSIVIQNTFDGKMEIEKGVIYSRKRDKEEGVGLKSMREICEKYCGTIEIKWNEDKFTVLIMLPINQ